MTASNTLLTIDMITYEALRLLTNNLSFSKGINREYSDRFAVTGAKIGDTLRVRKPAKYLGQTAVAISSFEDITETSTTITIDKYFMVPLEFSASELTLDIDNFSKRILSPAVARIANYVDEQCLGLYKDVYNIVGTPGTTPTDLLTYLNAGRLLDEEAAPMDGNRYVCVNPAAQVGIVNALRGLFQASDQIAMQYKRGRMGTSAGFEWMMDQNVAVHTFGVGTGTPLIKGGSQTGASIDTDGWTISQTPILKAGDVITIDGVYAVNPMNYSNTGQLRNFVVTAAANSDGSGNATLVLSPAIVTSAGGAFQNVTAGPADNAPITVIGGSGVVSPQNIACHPDAFTLAMVDLPLPDGVDMAGRKSDPDNGISVRFIRQWDNTEGQYVNRLDVLFGVKTLRPELAVRVAG